MRQVRILSLFLAMAEGLDESQEHCITRVICTSYKAAMDLRVYTDRENFDVPAHATASLVKDFEKTFHLPLRIQWFPGSSHRNELVEAAQKL